MMKPGLLSLSLASLAMAATIERRQSLAAIAQMVPAVNPIIIDVKPQLRTNSKRQLLRFGPFELPANKGEAAAPAPMTMPAGHSHGGGSMPAQPKGGQELGALLSAQKPMDPNGFMTTKRVAGGFCTDCTVIAGKSTVVFENGDKADISKGVYLHHALAIDATKAKPTYLPACPNDSAAAKGGASFSPFLGGAVDEFTQLYTTPDGKFNSGYYIRNHTFLLQTEIVNYRPTPQKVYVQIDVEYVPGKVGIDASQGTLASTACNNALQVFTPKKGEIGEVKSDAYNVPMSGTLLALRGHMHDGGKAVKMLVNNKQVCSSDAIYGGTGSTLIVDGKEWQTITKMAECAGPIAINKDDKITIVAQYDTVAHPPRESHGEEQEGMGIMTFVFVPSASK